MQKITQRTLSNCSRRLLCPATFQQKCGASLQFGARAYSVVPTPRDKEEKEMVHRILRVDHAGEFGANRIYAGQMAVLGRSKIGPLIQQMWDQEKKHLAKFNEILSENRVRPTALLPFWNIAGFVLGASTALLGKEGAMACTVAVEESISEHYNSQIRVLMEKDPERYTELLQMNCSFFPLTAPCRGASSRGSWTWNIRSLKQNWDTKLSRNFGTMRWSTMIQDWSMMLNRCLVFGFLKMLYSLVVKQQ
uniref:Coenzyme Q7 homolog, ubiquinone (yeast) n=1 Tax=Oryzias latipes TaxID=8090 RepID=H2MDX0_ORYLA